MSRFNGSPKTKHHKDAVPVILLGVNVMFMKFKEFMGIENLQG